MQSLDFRVPRPLLDDTEETQHMTSPDSLQRSRRTRQAAVVYCKLQYLGIQVEPDGSVRVRRPGATKELLAALSDVGPELRGLIEADRLLSEMGEAS